MSKTQDFPNCGADFGLRPRAQNFQCHESTSSQDNSAWEGPQDISSSTFCGW